jgi:glucose/arabinose dehydrogenase
MTRPPTRVEERAEWLGGALGLAWIAALATGCYVMRPSGGGGEISGAGSRIVQPADIALPAGYGIEVVATGLAFPTGVTFDDQGRVYVVEAGYSYGEVFSTPRLIRLEPDGGRTLIATGKNPPWTGVAFTDGAFIISEGGMKEGIGRILRVTPDGQMTPLVEGLPNGDHHTNGPVIGPDGYIYFGQGTRTNSGVVGEDNFKHGWATRSPQLHDIPCKDIKLSGVNYTSKNPLTPEKDDKIATGAFVPFGQPTEAGQVIPGKVPCSGAIMKVPAKGGDVELVAWGFRNPFGLAFSPDGKLYATDNGYDDRGSRPVWGNADWLWAVTPGTWYGWPDHADGRGIAQERYRPVGHESVPVALLAESPNAPPQPAAFFAVHSSSDGIDFSRSAAFGYVGDAFVAQFGDQSPDVGKVVHPVGYKIVRVDVKTGVIRDFATNYGSDNGPASKLEKGGLERPVSVKFDREGKYLYVVDFGILRVGMGEYKPREGTGVLWRIRSFGAAPG